MDPRRSDAELNPQGRGESKSIDGNPLLWFDVPMVGKTFGRLLNRSLLWLYKKFEVDRFHDIAISDFDRSSPHFRRTIQASLQLILNHDPIRFGRVQRHIGLIVNGFLVPGKAGEYDPEHRVCTIDFKDPQPNDDEPWHQIFYAAFYAQLIVHEATHGELHSRGIRYTPDMRVRIEKFCFLEENRFARRVARRARERSESDLAAIMENLESEFDSSAYEADWSATKLEQLRAIWKRCKES